MDGDRQEDRTERERERKQVGETDRPTGGQRFCYVLTRVRVLRGMSQAGHLSNCGGLHATLRLGPRGSLLVTERSSIKALGREVSGERTMSSVYMCGWDGGGGISGKASASSVTAPDISRAPSGSVSSGCGFRQGSQVSSSPRMWS